MVTSLAINAKPTVYSSTMAETSWPVIIKQAEMTSSKQRGPRGAGRQNPIKPISVTKPSYERFEEIKKRRAEKEDGQKITNDILIMEMMDVYMPHLSTSEVIPDPDPKPVPEPNADSDKPYYRPVGSDAKFGDEGTYEAFLGDRAPFYAIVNGKFVGNAMITERGYELVYQDMICRSIDIVYEALNLFSKGTGRP